MTVGELKKLIEGVDESLEIRVDNDENGWYSLESVESGIDEDSEEMFINLVSSSEA